MSKILCFLATAATLAAQSFTGSILGVVTDSSGAVVPNVTVTVVSKQTAERRTAQSTAAGQYTVSALPPGDYDLEVEVQGFRSFHRQGLRLDVLQNVRVDVVLEPGAVSDTVTVKGDSPLLETTNASIGQVIDNARIVDLPLNGRNSLALVALTPGAQTGRSGQFGGQPVNENPYAQGDYSINSGLQSQSEALVDGVPNNVFLWNAPAFVPSVAAVEEFKVQTSSFSAEFGHTGGGIVNVTIKSGTNRFHGSIFEFLRNDNLDANNFFNNRSGGKKPQYTYNQFGGAVGGPVRLPHYNGRDKTFFFFNYEGFRQAQGRTILTTVPQLAQRSGDFSSTRNAAGQLVSVYDPLTVRSTPGVGSGYSRDAFPGNRIPSSRFDPVSAKLIGYWAVPNLSGTGPAQTDNFLGNPSVKTKQDQVNVKVDQVWNDKQRTFGRYSKTRLLPGQADLFGTAVGARPVNPFELSTALLVWTNSVALDHTWLLSPTLLANFRYGMTRQRQFRDPASLGTDMTSLGFARSFNDAVQIRAVPPINLQGLQAIGNGSNTYFRRGDNVHSWQSSFTKTLTRQTLKLGFEFRSFLFNDTRAPDGSGNFTFSPVWTQSDPLRTTATAGNSVASFLLGFPASGQAQFFPAVSLNQNYYALYFQDDLRLTSKLTLNLGIRWDYESPKTERYNRLSSFDASLSSPLSRSTGLNLTGGLRFVGVDSEPRGQWASEWNNFAPRVGFAYLAAPRLVVRGGYGIFFHSTVGQGGLVGNGNDGFGAVNAVVTSTDGGISPLNRISNPFPSGMPLPTGSSLGSLTRVGQALQQWDRLIKLPYSQQYNFGLQYEIPKLFLIDAEYVGRHAIGLPVVLARNQMRPEYLTLGSTLLQQVPNPFFGVITEGVLSTQTIARNRLLRPFPQFDGISLYTSIAQESYNSLQLRLERRMTRGFGFLAAYTAGKSLTNAGGGGGAFSGFNQPGFQNVYDLRGERSLSPIDVSQRLALSYQWELPIGKGRWLLSGSGKAIDALLGGWQFNGITTIQTGYPLAIGANANQVQAFSGSRADVLMGISPNLPSGERSIARWFNTAAFAQPAQFQFGNVSRTLPSTRGPGYKNFDLSLFKSFPVAEKAKLQLRFEFFNAFNRANFGNPATTVGVAQFGQINSTDPARIIQVAAKLDF